MHGTNNTTESLIFMFIMRLNYRNETLDITAMPVSDREMTDAALTTVREVPYHQEGITLYALDAAAGWIRDIAADFPYCVLLITHDGSGCCPFSHRRELLEVDLATRVNQVRRDTLAALCGEGRLKAVEGTAECAARIRAELVARDAETHPAGIRRHSQERAYLPSQPAC